MTEKWTAISQEVNEGPALHRRRIPARRVYRHAAEGVGNRRRALGPHVGTTTITYHTRYAVEDNREVRDINGTLIGETRKTLMVNATGVTPTDDGRVFVGEELQFQDDATDGAVDWVEIAAVRLLAPAGVAVLYEVDLVK